MINAYFSNLYGKTNEIFRYEMILSTYLFTLITLLRLTRAIQICPIRLFGNHFLHEPIRHLSRFRQNVPWVKERDYSSTHVLKKSKWNNIFFWIDSRQFSLKIVHVHMSLSAMVDQLYCWVSLDALGTPSNTKPMVEKVVKKLML